jgi:hypothetical protein
MGIVTRDGYIVGPVRESFYGILHHYLPLSSGAVDTSDSVGIDGQADVHIERQAVLADNLQATAQFQVAPGQLWEDTEQFLSMYGTGQFPRVLPSPMVLPGGATFTMRAWDRQSTSAANTIRFLSIGKKVYARPFLTRRRYAVVRPFTLTANFTSTGVQQSTPLTSSGDTSQASVNVSSEWDFEIRKLVIVSDGPFTLQAQVSGKALGWFNKACHSWLLGGTYIQGAVIQAGAWPFVLPAPEHVTAGGAIQVSIADLSQSATYPNRVKIGFLGNRLYPPGGLPMIG